MKQTKAKTATSPQKKTVSMGQLFEKDNFKWMLIGGVVMAIGFLLMAGGRSEDPTVFNPKEVYGFRRITIAPIVILAGLAIEIYDIFRSPKTS